MRQPKSLKTQREITEAYLVQLRDLRSRGLRESLQGGLTDEINHSPVDALVTMILLISQNIKNHPPQRVTWKELTEVSGESNAGNIRMYLNIANPMYTASVTFDHAGILIRQFTSRS